MESILEEFDRLQIEESQLKATVRVLVYVSFPFVRSDYVISAGVGFRVASGVVASP